MTNCNEKLKNNKIKASSFLVHKNNIQFSLFIKIIIFRDMKEECVEITMYFPQTKVYSVSLSVT
jgi:hypothetical protein